MIENGSLRVWPRLVPVLALLYLPFIGGGFLTDDFAHVDHLTRVRSVGGLVTSPDTFGFYRPATQISFAAAPGADGARPAMARAVNLALHAGVISLAIVVGRLILGSTLAAGLAALAFALTPKAAPIAVLWISARADLLMAAFALAAIAAWIVWIRGGHWSWLAATAAAYVLALSSKETAALLPLLLAFTPARERPLASRLSVIAMLIGIGAAFYVVRASLGALTPFSGDEHYSLAVPLTRWVRNATNYAGRMLIAPLALVATAVVGWALSRTRAAAAVASQSTPAPIALFSFAWVVVFMTPVLPIVARSELYLYMPTLGLCLLAGWIAAEIIRRANNFRIVGTAFGVLIVALGAYQIARARDVHRDLVFSARFVHALGSSADVRGRSGEALVMPSDATTERYLRDAIGGYLYLAIQRALPGTQLTAAIHYRGDTPREADVRLSCAYRQRDGAVIISPVP